MMALSVRHPFHVCSGIRQLSALVSNTLIKPDISFKHETLKITVMPSGMTVASLDAGHNGLSHVGIFIKGGSSCVGDRIEEEGMGKAMVFASGLGTKHYSQFGLRRNMDQLGSQLNCFVDRDYLCYSTSIIRDFVDDGIDYLLDNVCSPCYKSWEVADIGSRLHIDNIQATPKFKSIEFLHKAAYRTNLGNSLLCPTYMEGRHKPSQFASFHEKQFTSENCAFVGIGVPHASLLQYANLVKLPSGSGKVSPSKYYGGEVRVSDWTSDKSVIVCLALEGASISGSSRDEILASMIIAEILGGAPRVKYSNGMGKLQKSLAAVSKSTANKVTVLQRRYAGSGLVGALINIDGSNEEDQTQSVVQAIAKTLRTFNVTDAELKAAKKKLLAKIGDDLLSSNNALQHIGVHVLFGKPDAVKATFEEQSVADSIVGLSLDSVQAFAKKMTSSKLSMSCYGNIVNVPYLDTL